jgi:hypothetical protein
MGSSGSRPRRNTGQHQHLPKVGTTAENERLLHEEQQAVLDNIGLGRLPGWAKMLIGLVIVVAFVAAILGLVILN